MRDRVGRHVLLRASSRQHRYARLRRCRFRGRGTRCVILANLRKLEAFRLRQRLDRRDVGDPPAVGATGREDHDPSTEPEFGALPNFRFVLDMAVSELFMWHACDDRLAPNFLEEMVGIMAAEPECALACSTTVVVEQDGTPARKDSFPPPSGTSRTDRVRQLLAQPQATRIYGLFRIDALRKVQALAEEFGQVWSVDHLQLLELALNDRIRGTDRTSFYFRRGSPTGARYRPTTLSERLRFAGRYLRFHLRLFGHRVASRSARRSVSRRGCWCTRCEPSTPIHFGGSSSGRSSVWSKS